MMFTILLFGLGGAISGGVSILDKVRAAVDHMVELKHRERTGRSNRQHVRFDMDLTPEGFLKVSEDPTILRGRAAFAVRQSMGEVDSCSECGAAVVQ
jgi:hypothetical protein